MKDFKELKVWKKAHKLTLAVYKGTRSFPKEELYGLTSQMRRSCSSIPTNIAEGCGRSGDAELRRFLHIAMGSASELQYHVLLARDLGLLDELTHDRLANDVSVIKRMLTSFIKKLNADR
jgi:four helix bundle protein